jgi:hypothetical protein
MRIKKTDWDLYYMTDDLSSFPSLLFGASFSLVVLICIISIYRCKRRESGLVQQPLLVTNNGALFPATAEPEQNNYTRYINQI